MPKPPNLSLSPLSDFLPLKKNHHAQMVFRNAPVALAC